MYHQKLMAEFYEVITSDRYMLPKKEYGGRKTDGVKM
jgi:hypothetical protein